MKEYIILESKLNHINIEEMEMMFKDYYENKNPLGSTKKRKLEKLPKYITKHKNSGSYVVIRTINLKRYYIGSFYSLKSAKTALNKFNVNHGCV